MIVVYLTIGLVAGIWTLHDAACIAVCAELLSTGQSRVGRLAACHWLLAVTAVVPIAFPLYLRCRQRCLADLQTAVEADPVWSAASDFAFHNLYAGRPRTAVMAQLCLHGWSKACARVIVTAARQHTYAPNSRG